MTADDNYSRRNMKNFPQQVQTLLSQKEKTFSGFFITIMKCAENVEHFEKTDEYSSLLNSEIVKTDRGGYLNVWKVLLQNNIQESTS